MNERHVVLGSIAIALILVVGLGVYSAMQSPEVASAGSGGLASSGKIHYSGRAYVDRRYTHVGSTPQHIIIKTNVRFKKSVFNPGSVLWLYPKKMIITRFTRLKITLWMANREKVYTNTLTMAGGYANQEFKAYWFTYHKHWWDIFYGRSYIGFSITIPKDKDLIFTHSRTEWISVYLEGKTSEVKFASGFPFASHEFSVAAHGGVYVYPF